MKQVSTTWVSHENMILIKLHILWFPLYQLSRIVKSIGINKQTVVARNAKVLVLIITSRIPFYQCHCQEWFYRAEPEVSLEPPGMAPPPPNKQTKFIREREARGDRNKRWQERNSTWYLLKSEKQECERT